MRTEQDLLDDAARLCAHPRLYDVVRSQTGWPASGNQRQLDLHIHASDQMLMHSLRHHRDSNAAVSQYFNVALQQYKSARQVIDLLWPAQQQPLIVLDFACGFGRLIRFLRCDPRPLQIYASEIQRRALNFVATTFDVSPLMSSLTPEAFTPPERFHLIWVASLFSHLPKDLFERWLVRLRALLRPDGVLCFTVHDALLAPSDMPLSAEGYLFLSQSENDELDRTAYGTTYVTESFVRRIVHAQVDPYAELRRLPKALAHEQDLYVLAGPDGPDLTRLAGFRRGPWGWVDEHRIDGHDLVLRGWAASIDDGVLPAVSIRVGDQLHSCPTGLNRPDVAEVFSDPRLASSGWSFRMQLGRSTGQWVDVTADSSRGESALLYAGWPGGCDETTARFSGQPRE